MKHLRPIVLIGAGGHCRSVIDAVESVGRQIAGIIDVPECPVNEIYGYPVLGTDDDIISLSTDHDFIVTLGMTYTAENRLRLHRLISRSNGKLATIIASTAYVSHHAAIGPGTVVLHHAVINAGARVGTGCIINTSAVVEHDSTIGDYTHISTGAIVNGGSSIGRECMIGSHATILQGISVCDKTIIGASATVIKSIHRPGVYIGLVKGAGNA